MANRISRQMQALRRWLAEAATNQRAEAELRALDERELRDLGLGRGGIAYAVRCGRDGVVR